MGQSNTPRDGVPEDYPGRVAEFPEGRDHLVIMLIGTQGNDDASRSEFLATMLRLTALTNGPERLERGDSTDAAGLPTTTLLAYWLDPAMATAWWQSQEVTAFWQGLPLDGPAGYFYERMSVPCERFNYAAGVEDRHGSAAILPLGPSATFGYWGAYRDRLPASVDDDFACDFDTVPERSERETRQRRVSVTPPNNVCYIREGQGWGNCGAEERQIWDEKMTGVIDAWVERLGGNPAETGCLSVRDCTEIDAPTGSPIARRTQIAFLLSLGHIEQAARTDPAHLAVHGAFVKMYTEPRFTPRMHVWVEIGVMKHGEVETEYVNCHPMTGLLPYFDA